MSAEKPHKSKKRDSKTTLGAFVMKSNSPQNLANLGPRSTEFLLSVGITTIGQLERLGSVAAYALVKKSEPTASLNLLWAIEGALTGLHWREVAKEHRTSLLLALETHEDNTKK